MFTFSIIIFSPDPMVWTLEHKLYMLSLVYIWTVSYLWLTSSSSSSLGSSKRNCAGCLPLVQGIMLTVLLLTQSSAAELWYHISIIKLFIILPFSTQYLCISSTDWPEMKTTNYILVKCIPVSHMSMVVVGTYVSVNWWSVVAQDYISQVGAWWLLLPAQGGRV